MLLPSLAGSRQAPIGVPAFTSIDLLPFLQPSVQTHEFTSCDRAGDNYDADYFPIYKEPNGEYVLFDSYGPGCLYRLHMNIWNGDLGSINIRFYFDDEPRPRIDMDVTKFFSRENPLGVFKEPMAHTGEGYRFVYHPFFYSHRLKVALSREPLGHEPGWDKLPWLGRYDKHPYRRNHWYEFTYHTYSQNPGIHSWSAPAEMSSVATFWDTSQIGRPAKIYAGAITSRFDASIPQGATRNLLDLTGAATITALRITVDKADEAALLDAWLAVRFDGAKAPQVEAPLACFFGIYRRQPDKRIASRLVGCQGSKMYCYLPMPFWKSIGISVSNRSGRALSHLHAEIEHVSARDLNCPRDACGTFHAIYHRESPRRAGHDYRYADLHGRGQLVGHFVYRLNTSMEEDERTYFDGSRTPAIYGEGFEDDHNKGWGQSHLQRAMYGSTASNGGDGAPWRFYIPELYVFQSAACAGHQVYGPHSPRGHEGMYQVGEEESVTFAYVQDKAGLEQSDELDVGNRSSERAHRYRALGTRQNRTGTWWYDGEENNVLFGLPPIVDDGVSTSRGSEFSLRLDPKNHGVRLRRRAPTRKTTGSWRVFTSTDGW